MLDPMVFGAKWLEDGTASILARVTSRHGTGSATTEKGEGNWLKQADISSITYRCFDVTDPDNATEITSGATSVTISSAIQDTPVTSTALWTQDNVGYNFIHDLPASCFPTGSATYRVEYKFTLSGGSVIWALIEGDALKVYSS